mmetsp:Transcript_16669/g.18368  ORF Transcript_16669/g.18368 Transcript_16669/m.18368 type:complete len:160 (-) Transcript_16669:549-1028(-)
MRLGNKAFTGLILISSIWASFGFLLQKQQNQHLFQRHPSATGFIIHQRQQPKFRSDMISVLNRHRRSVSNVQTMGLFGLGAPEVGIIIVVATFIIGPQKVGSMLGKFTGGAKNEFDGLPSELKKIPKEFQKGFDESSKNAKARNAKQMEAVPDEDVIKK